MASLRNLALFLGAALPAAVFAAPAPAPINIATQESVAGRYIVTLKNGINALDFDSHLKWLNDEQKRSLERRGLLGEITSKIFQFDTFNAYATELDDTLLGILKLSADVLGIEEEQIFSLSDAPAEGLRKRELTTQKNATWGLGTISHREKGSKEYVYDDTAGEGTWAYVIDSGVRTTHVEFEDRAIQGYNAIPETGDADEFGHGTHVSGTIAGKTVGVAKKANIVGIKTFDPKTNTNTGEILDAINWAVNDITEKGRKDKSVINMSLTGGSSEALDNAVNSAFDAGILVVVAAGNNGDAASEWSPAKAEKAFTVGSIDETWEFSSFSNYGPEVNILAPGRAINSAYGESDSDYFEDSGTSMASPHVAGVAAYLMAKEGGSAADIRKRIVDLATSGVVPNTKESANKILYNGNAA